MDEISRHAGSRLRLTLGCFLSYFIVSGLISQIGVVTSPMAVHFGRALTDVAGQFTWLSMGVSLGSLLSLVCFEWVGLRRCLLVCYALAACALLVLVGVDRWAVLGPALGIVGVFCGLGLNASAVTLALTWSDQNRPRILLLTDVCFAAAGIVMAPLAARLVGAGLPWNASYTVLALLCLVLLAVVASNRYPPSAREAGVAVAQERWPLAAWLCGAGLLFYLFGQVTMLIWLPADAASRLSMDSTAGAALISRYWTGMVVGQLLLVLLLLRHFSLRALLPVVVALSALVSFGLWSATTAREALWATTLLGLCNAGVLKLTLSFGATLVRHPQRIVTALLFSGSFGQAVCPYISARFVAWFDSTAALELTSVCAVLMALCIGAACLRGPARLPVALPAD